MPDTVPERLNPILHLKLDAGWYGRQGGLGKLAATPLATLASPGRFQGMIMANAHLRVLSTREVARKLGMTTGSIRRLALSGELVGRKIGERAWAFDEDEVEKFQRRDAKDDGTRGGRPRRGGPEDE